MRILDFNKLYNWKLPGNFKYEPVIYKLCVDLGIYDSYDEAYTEDPNDIMADLEDEDLYPLDIYLLNNYLLIDTFTYESLDKRTTEFLRFYGVRHLKLSVFYSYYYKHEFGFDPEGAHDYIEYSDTQDFPIEEVMEYVESMQDYESYLRAV